MFIYLLFYVKASSSIPAYLFLPRRSTLTVCDLLSSQLDSPRHQPIRFIKTSLHTCTCEIYIQQYSTNKTSRNTFFIYTYDVKIADRTLTTKHTPHTCVYIGLGSELGYYDRMYNCRQSKIYKQDRQGTLMLVCSTLAGDMDITSLPVVVEHSRWELTGGGHQPCFIPATFQNVTD